MRWRKESLFIPNYQAFHSSPHLRINALSTPPHSFNSKETDPFHFPNQLLVSADIIYIIRGEDRKNAERGGGKFLHPQLTSLSFIPPPQNQCFANPSSLPQFRRDGALSPDHTISCVWRYNIHSSKGRME